MIQIVASQNLCSGCVLDLEDADLGRLWSLRESVQWCMVLTLSLYGDDVSYLQPQFNEGEEVLVYCSLLCASKQIYLKKKLERTRDRGNVSLRTDTEDWCLTTAHLSCCPRD